MSTQRIYTMNEVKKEDSVKAVKTPFYQTASTGDSVWVIKPGQTLQKHRHNNSDDIWVVLQGQGIFLSGAGSGGTVLCRTGACLGKRQCHGAKNTGEEDIIFVSIVAPVPADYQPIGE